MNDTMHQGYEFIAEGVYDWNEDCYRSSSGDVLTLDEERNYIVLNRDEIADRPDMVPGIYLCDKCSIAISHVI